MSDNEDQEPSDKQPETSDTDGEVDAPPLDFGELKGTGDADASLDSAVPDANEPKDIDDTEDIIDISDEDLQQEFIEMEQEELEASKQTEAATEAEADTKTEAEPFELSMAGQDNEVEKENNPTRDRKDDPALGDLDELNTSSDDSPDASRFNELFSQKIIYGSVAAAFSVAAIVMVLIFGFGSDDPEIEAAVALEEETFPFVTREPAAELQPQLDEEPPLTIPESNEELAIAEEETPVGDEQAEDASLVEDAILADDVELAVTEPQSIDEAEALTEEVATVLEDAAEPTEENPAATEVEVVEADETPALTEETENETEELQLAVEDSEIIAEEAPLIADEETPAATETQSITSEEAPVFSPQMTANLITLNESSNNFYIIVASFNSEEMALKHVSSLPEEMETSLIIPPFEQDSKYRVAIAGYATMAEAQANIPMYKEEYGDDIWPLRFSRVDRGTLLSERTGNTYVVVSSFLTENSARLHISGLADTGIEPQIIPPFGQSRSYRVTIVSYETLAAAQQALPGHKEQYGDDIWLLRY